MNNPFLKLKVRSLFLRFVLLSFILAFSLGFLERISGLKFNQQLITLILYILIFGFLALWEIAEFNQLGIKLKYVVGSPPKNYRWLSLVGLVMLMLMFSISAYLVLFYLLSLVAPSFVEAILRQVASQPSLGSSAPPFFNLLTVIVLVVVAPITEEFIFRGIILQRWATKWGLRTSLILTSLLFGTLHANILGLTVFGMIMGVLYIKTRTLIVPIACHALNNLSAATIEFLPHQSSLEETNSLEHLRSSLGVGVFFLLISVPLLLRFFQKNWPSQNTPIPYLINASPAEI